MWKPATPGEVLYQYVHRELGVHTRVEVRKHPALEGTPVPFESGRVEFSEWIRHAVTSHIVARILLYGRELVYVEDPSELSQPLRMYALERLGLVSTLIDIDELVRLTVLAREGSRKEDPTNSERHQVFEEWLPQRCYLCGEHYKPAEAVKSPASYTLDHIWPLSLGGSTTPTNLAPCCNTCNKQKDNIYGWPWGQVHRYFMRKDTFITERDRKLHRIWLPNHLMELMVFATRQDVTLKEAAFAVGPKIEVTLADPEDIAHFFNVSTLGVPA